MITRRGIFRSLHVGILITAFLTFSASSDILWAKRAAYYLPLKPLGIMIRKHESRIIDNVSESVVLQAIRDSLLKDDYVIDLYHPDLGLITFVKSKNKFKVKSAVVLSIISGLFGNYPEVDKNEEIFATVITRTVGKNRDKVLVQVRFLRVNWGAGGKILKVQIVDNVLDFSSFYYSLSKQLGRPVREIK